MNVKHLGVWIALAVPLAAYSAVRIITNNHQKQRLAIHETIFDSSHGEMAERTVDLVFAKKNVVHRNELSGSKLRMFDLVAKLLKTPDVKSLERAKFQAVLSSPASLPAGINLN